MLFIIAMDVLTRLISKAQDLRLLEPLARRQLDHRMSIYADDVVMFSSAKEEDIRLIRDILRKFGDASGSNANMAKSSIIPIRCDEEQIQVVKQQMDYQISKFPCKYFGLSLSIRKLTKADLQPILNRVDDALPGWKAELMARSGRLV